MLQDINWRITIIHEDLEIDEFKIQGETKIKPKEKVEEKKKEEKEEIEIEILKKKPTILKRDRDGNDITSDVIFVNKSKKIEIIEIE